MESVTAKAIKQGLMTQFALRGKSLFLFGNSNKFRIKIAKITNSKKFETVILFFIVASSILLALENPLDDPNGSKMKLLNNLDIFMTVIFTLECILKVLANGFIINGSHSYLKNGWNIIDFIIVAFSVSFI
jgi:hypothetical protein